MINIIIVECDGVRNPEDNYNILDRIESLPESSLRIFMCKRKCQDECGLAEEIGKRYPESTIYLGEEEWGEASSLSKVLAYTHEINNGQDMLVSFIGRCDNTIDFDPNKFQELRDDSDLVIWSVFNSSEPEEPNIQLETDEGYFIQAHRDSVLDDNRVSVGTYYFRDWNIYIQAYNNLQSTWGAETEIPYNEVAICDICNFIDESVKAKVFDVIENTTISEDDNNVVRPTKHK